MSEQLLSLLNGFIPQVGNINHIRAMKKLHEFRLLNKKVKLTKAQRELKAELDEKICYLLTRPLE